MGVVPPGMLAIGMQLPVQAQSRVFVEPWEREAGPDELVDVAVHADAAGFFYVGACDHLAIPASRREQMGATWYDPLTTLAFVAAATHRVRLLTHVYVLALRPPVAAAKAFATLDRLSGGRVIIGVGAGHVVEEFEQAGVPFDRRGAVLDEAIDALRVLLTDDPASFAGGRVRFDDLAVAPRPVQQPPPIWVGGSRRPALRRVAARGDGWIPQGTPLADMPDQLAVIRAHLDGRDTTTLDLGAMAPPMYVGTPGWDVGRWTVTGTPDRLAGTIRDYADLGCNHVQVRLRSRTAGELLDQIDRFGRDVMPLL